MNMNWWVHFRAAHTALQNYTWDWFIALAQYGKYRMITVIFGRPVHIISPIVAFRQKQYQCLCNLYCIMLMHTLKHTRTRIIFSFAIYFPLPFSIRNQKSRFKFIFNGKMPHMLFNSTFSSHKFRKTHSPINWWKHQSHSVQKNQ